MHQETSYSLVKPTIITSEKVSVAVLDDEIRILYNVFSARPFLTKL